MVLKISIVGTHQSGSTRLFNLCRLIFEQANMTVHSCWNYNHSRDSDFDVIINKIHDKPVPAIKNNYDIILLPIRNLVDSAISYSKRHNLPIKLNAVLAHCRKNISRFQQFKSVATHIVYYEKYSMREVRLLCTHLGVKLTSYQIISIMQELHTLHNSKEIVANDNRKDEQYKKTLLSQRHNTSGGASNKFVHEMNIADIDAVLNTEWIKPFMESHQYM